MINTEFIIKYTNALYSTPREFAPRYDEFRDMFSSGQLYSKQWLIRELSSIPHISSLESVMIVGAWFGTLGIMIRNEHIFSTVNMLDIDDRCWHFVNNIIHNDDSVNYFTKDMYEYHYHEDVIINTSCEHIPDIREWLNCIPSGRTVVLQSNDFSDGDGHINCVRSVDEFINKAGLREVYYSGSLEMPMYTRYMIMGKT